MTAAKKLKKKLKRRNVSKSYDDEMAEREFDKALKAALAKGDHKQADALVEANKVETKPAGEIL